MLLIVLVCKRYAVVCSSEPFFMVAFLLKRVAYVGLEPTNQGLGVACFTDCASRAILKLRNFNGFQCAFFLLISCIPLANSELFFKAILCSKDPPNVGSW